MKITDKIPEEKLAVFYKAALDITKEHLQEDVAMGAMISLLEHFGFDNISREKEEKLVHVCCDNYRRGMAVAMALIEAGIINIQTLEVQKKKGV